MQSLGAGWMNLASLVLGVVSWILPLVGMGWKKGDSGRALIFSFLSVAACAASLCLQLHYSNYLVRIEDWSALMDTSGAVATFLLLTTLVLNAVALLVCYYKTKAREL